MIQYRCSKCNAEREFSTCPVCGVRTVSESKVYWCESCNIPIWDDVCPKCNTKGKYIASDIRPVFPAERLLLELIKNAPFKYSRDSVWFGGGRYIVNGKSVRLSSSEWQKADTNELRRALLDLKQENEETNFFDEYIHSWIVVNAKRYETITAEAMDAIQSAAKGFSPEHMFVSFSGGKDSTVTSDLVIRALGAPEIIHIYGNTTLEFPESLKYVRRFREAHPRTPVLTAQNRDKNFYEMCDIVGPPSRVKRWCCTLFKTGAITKRIEKSFGDAKHILSFQGIRRSESMSRSKYERQSSNSKISKQEMFSPIIDRQLSFLRMFQTRSEKLW